MPGGGTAFRSAEGGVDEHQLVHLITRAAGQRLRDEPAKGKAEDVRSVQPHCLDDSQGVVDKGIHAVSGLGFVTLAGPPVVEGDDPERPGQQPQGLPPHTDGMADATDENERLAFASLLVPDADSFANDLAHRTPLPKKQHLTHPVTFSHVHVFVKMCRDSPFNRAAPVTPSRHGLTSPRSCHE